MILFEWDENPDLNITPFVDVMLVLMSILMVTAPAVVYRENINLPKGTKSERVKKSPDLNIRLDRSRVVHFDGKSYPLHSFKKQFVKDSTKISLDRMIYISADKELRYEDVMYLLRTLKFIGFTKVSLLTE